MRPDRFGRLFPNLKPFAEPKPKVVAALKALGAQGGPMDVGDDLAAGPLDLILNPGANRDNAAHTAGMTFVGQFIDHDLTLDATSPLASTTAAGGDGQPPLARVRPGLGLRQRAVRRPDPLRGRQLRLKVGRRARSRTSPGCRTARR